MQVQRIKNEFTVTVYEIHARMALESVSVHSSLIITSLNLVVIGHRQSDMVEYNACQATLKNLYETGIKGKREEFTAYRILTLLHGHNRTGLSTVSCHIPSLTCSGPELNLYVGQLTTDIKMTPPVQHALAVSRALAMGNYHALFDLYLNAPNMGGYIMDHFVERERIRAMLVITKSSVVVNYSVLIPYASAEALCTGINKYPSIMSNRSSLSTIAPKPGNFSSNTTLPSSRTQAARIQTRTSTVVLQVGHSHKHLKRSIAGYKSRVPSDMYSSFIILHYPQFLASSHFLLYLEFSYFFPVFLHLFSLKL